MGTQCPTACTGSCLACREGRKDPESSQDKPISPKIPPISRRSRGSMQGAEIWGHSLELNLFCCAMSCSPQSRAQLAAPQTPGKFLGAKLFGSRWIPPQPFPGIHRAHAPSPSFFSQSAFISRGFKETRAGPTLLHNCGAIYHLERKSHVTTPWSTRNNVRNSFICDQACLTGSFLSLKCTQIYSFLLSRQWAQILMMVY